MPTMMKFGDAEEEVPSKANGKGKPENGKEKVAEKGKEAKKAEEKADKKDRKDKKENGKKEKDEKKDQKDKTKEKEDAKASKKMRKREKRRKALEKKREAEKKAKEEGNASSDESSESDEEETENKDKKEKKAAEDETAEKKNKKEKKEKKDKKEKKRKAEAEEKDSDGDSSSHEQVPQPDKKKAKQEHTNGHSNGQTNIPKSTMSSSEVNTWRTQNNLTVTNPDESNNPCAPFVNFSDAPFPAYVTASLKSFGFATPTQIQAQGWPLLLQGRDVVGIAETGSGKTLAFGYPAIMHIKNKQKKAQGPKAMVLAPTRELAQQIHEVLTKACEPAGLSACCVFGGMPKDAQYKALQTSDIVVATPGRLIDLLEDGSKLSNVEFVVFDEADRMLDMGFIPQIKRIIEHLPSAANRQTLMFSATWPVDVQKFAQTYLRTPVQINIGAKGLTGAKKVTQIVEVCQRPEEKNGRLKQLLKKLTAEGRPKILIFMLYKHTCASMEQELAAAKWNVDSLHGNKTQPARDKAVENFKSGKANILVATDVASRGLDIKDIKYVINVELPLVMEDYVHRIGRTGRAGEEGTAYTLFCPDDKQHARQLVRILEDSGQTVPAELSKIAETAPVTKPRKTSMEQMYGAFAKGVDINQMMKKPTKTTFD